jgi:hypothetical protein
LEAIRRKYEEQEGKCLYCHCVLEFQTKGMGWNLCMEDREALGVWPSTDNLMTVDRVDASDPSIPYMNKDTGEENFSLLCFACNREKYYEEDAAEKLAARNAVLLRRVEELEKELLESRNALKENTIDRLEKVCSEHSHDLFRVELNSLMTQNAQLEQQLSTMRRLARNNFVQNVTIKKKNDPVTVTPPQKRKVEEKPVLKISINKKKQKL